MVMTRKIQAVWKICLILVLVYFVVLYRGSKGEDNGHCSKDRCPLYRVDFDEVNWKLQFFEDDKKYLTVTLPDVLKLSKLKPENCREENGLELCLNWERYGKITIRRDDSQKASCYHISWTVSSYDFKPTDCLSMVGAHWYGGSELHTQKWPIQEVDIPMQPFVSQDSYIKKVAYGNVLEPFWINSNGVGVIVPDSVPLHVGINQKASKQLCLKAEYTEPHLVLPETGSQFPALNYTICKGNNVKSIQQYIHRKYLDIPKALPDQRMIKSPIWSTWARYKTLIDQSKILEYANEIIKHNFTNSQLEIDDMFSTHYGEFNFDPQKFQNAKDMIHILKSKGFRVSVWVTPFANLDSDAFREGIKNGYWLKDKARAVPALVRWWQGIGGTIDVTNPEAVQWYVSRLENMRQQYGVDSFKFDAGEMTYMPSSYKTHRTVENPGIFTKMYVDTVSKLGNMIEVRCGYKSQKYPVFVRMADKDSKWGYDNGLRTIIPVALTLGILGYPFILPDMIGGNGYGEDMGTDAILPERELYIRWLQLTAFMPSMQFSFVPWQYDSKVVEIARHFVQIHETVVTPLLLRAAEETLETGAPLIRPLWWIAPGDTHAQSIDSEFLIGNEMLVAPILDKEARSRDVYLPAGKWKNEITGKEINGGQWINVKADLSEIPTFTKLGH